MATCVFRDPDDDDDESKPLLPSEKTINHTHNGAVNNNGDAVSDFASRSTIGLKCIVFLCGIATFARTEAVLLQTQFFAMCRGYGPQYFYAIAAALLFVPGPIVIAAVKWFEQGSRVPVATRMFRKVVVANITSAIALLLLVLEIVLIPHEAETSKLA